MEWFKFKPGAWLSKTRNLDPYVDGCFLRLCIEYMNTGKSLPDNDDELADVCRIPHVDFMEKVKPILFKIDSQGKGKFFHRRESRPGRWFQNTCEENLEAYAQLSIGGKKGAKARWGDPAKDDLSDIHDGETKNPEETTKPHGPPNSPPIAPPNADRRQKRERLGRESLKHTESLKNPPTPLPETSGVLKNVGWKDRHAETMLSEKAIDAARKWCPGWDLRGSIIPQWWKYVTGFAAPPDNPDGSLIAWAKRNIKGKRPP